MPAEYYEKVLYPLQDKAISVFKDSPFYLTGGTLLSRIYYKHRYSDDLDYFLNDHPEFQVYAERQVEKLSKVFNNVKVVMAYDRFYRILVGEERLKIELVNDVPAHIGDLVKHPQFGLIDSKENILTNKLTAVMDRAMPKDIVDIYFLLKDGINLKQALTDVHSKVAGVPPLYIAKILGEFDYSLLDTEIKWIRPVPSEEIKKFLTDIALKIVKGEL